MQSGNACAGVTAGAAPVNDAVRHSVPVSNLLSVQSVTATQSESVDAGPVNDSLAPSMIQGLQDRAHAGFQATAQVVREHVDLARQSANERVKVAKAGKKLLDEGGDSVAQMVVAKKASLVASEMDLSVADSVRGAIVKLDASVAQLREAESLEGGHFSPIEHEASFLAGDHERHAATCRRIAQMLATPSSSAAMSAEECDALVIVKAKEGCATVMSHTSDGLARMKQRTLGGASQSDDPVASSDQAPTLLQTGLGWFTEVSSTSYDDKLWNGFQKLQQAANDRVETAKNGKRLLESGGDNVEQMMLAKMACRDAADMDRVIAEKVQNAITLFDDSAAKLRCCSKTLLALEGAAAHSSLAQLAAEHETRANTYRQIAEMLKQPLATVEMNLAEWDALSLVKVKDGSLGALGALQSRTNEGFEALKSLAYPSVSSEIQRDSQRRRTVCA